MNWSEFLPRYLFIEDALVTRRVLEVGTEDTRSLHRLHQTGAVKVVGTAPREKKLPPVERGGAVELLAMEPGRLDFGEHSFDVVLVVDLCLQLSREAAFLQNLRRVLHPDGFCLLGFQGAGRTFTDLVQDGESGPLPPAAPQEIESAIRRVFPDVTFYHQAPFVGVAIQPEGVDVLDADVSLDPTLAAHTGPRPSHVIGLGGRGCEKPQDRTLIELPFLEFEAVTESARAVRAEVEQRLTQGLDEAREDLKEREKLLRVVGARLPELREAVRDRLLSSGNTSAERLKTLADAVARLEQSRGPLEARVEQLAAELMQERAARRALEAQARDHERSLVGGGADTEVHGLSPGTGFRGGNGEEDGARVAAEDLLPIPIAEFPTHDTVIEALESPSDGELEDLRTRVEELEALLREERKRAEANREGLQEEVRAFRAKCHHQSIDAERLKEHGRNLEAELDRVREEGARQSFASGEVAVAELAESRRQVHLLERTVRGQDEELHRLRRELEEHRALRQSFGTDYFDQEARVHALQRRLEDANLAHAEAQQHADERIAFLSNELEKVQQDREETAAKGQSLEHQLHDVVVQLGTEEERRALAIRQCEFEHSASLALERELDEARQEVFEQAQNIAALKRAMTDQSQEFRALKASSQEREADRKALEMAAQHLSREAGALRSRVQELRQERDALAATSALLLEERDQATELAKRVMDAEARAGQLSASLEGGQKAIERLEEELDRARHEKVESQKEIEGHKHVRAELEERLRGLERETSRLEGRGQQTESRVLGLDQQLAAFQHRLAAKEQALEAMNKVQEELQEALQDAEIALRASHRESRDWQERATQLEDAAREGEAQAGTLLAARARAEAELTRKVSAFLEVEGARALLKADAAELAQKLRSTQSALSHTLSQAAQVSERLMAVEAELAGMKAQAEAGQAELARMKAKAEAGRSEVARLKAQGEAGQTELARMKAEAEAGRSELARTRVEAEAGRSELARLKAEVEAGRAEAVKETTGPRDPRIVAGPVEEARLQRLETQVGEERAKRMDAFARIHALEDELVVARTVAHARVEAVRHVESLENECKRLRRFEDEACDLKKKLDIALAERERFFAQLERQQAAGSASERVPSEPERPVAVPRVPASSDGGAVGSRAPELAPAASRGSPVGDLGVRVEALTQELDQARADVGRKLREMRVLEHALAAGQEELEGVRKERDRLDTLLKASGSAEDLRVDLDAKTEAVARLKASTTALSSECHQLRALLQAAEQNEVSLERRIAELEASVAERTRRLGLVERELVEKTERLRRLAGLAES